MHYIRITLLILLAIWQTESYAQIAILENIHWKDEWLLSGDNKLIGTVNATAPLDVKMKCTKELVSDNTWEIIWTFTAKRDISNVRLTASFEHVSKPEWWMIPAVSYNGNHLSRGMEPKGEKRDRQWYTFSYKRTSKRILPLQLSATFRRSLRMTTLVAYSLSLTSSHTRLYGPKRKCQFRIAHRISIYPDGSVPTT